MPEDTLRVAIDVGASLACFPTLEDALAHAGWPAGAQVSGLFTADPAASRYVVLLSGPDALIAAVPSSAGCEEQLGSVIPVPDPTAITTPADLPPNVVLLRGAAGETGFSASIRPVFSYHWMREAAAGRFEGRLGVKIDAGLGASVDFTLSNGLAEAIAVRDGVVRLRAFQSAGARSGGGVSISAKARFDQPLVAPPAALEQAIASDLGLSGGQAVERAAALASAICGQALGAMEQRLSADLACRLQRAGTDTALLDCSFEFTAEGLAGFRAALEGCFPNLDAAGPVRVHDAALTTGLSQEVALEVHLPFLDRTQWTSRLEVMARARCQATQDGRIVAYTVDASDQFRADSAYQSMLALSGAFLSRPAPSASRPFRLAYSASETLKPVQAQAILGPVLEAYGFDGAALESLAAPKEGTWAATLTLTAPGSLCQAWLNAPGTRSSEFFEVYSRVSVAVQHAMRKWLPLVWFSDLDRYDDFNAAHALLVYQATRPYSGRPRSDFTYDVQSPDGSALLRKGLARDLAAVLKPVEQLLRAGGKRSISRFYCPDQAMRILAGVQRQPRLFNALLVADTFSVDSLVQLGTSGRAFTDTAASDPRTAVRRLATFAAGFVTAFHRKLRRLYGGRDFTAFGSLLLIEATRALNAAMGNPEASIAAVLRAAGASGELVFVNPAYAAVSSPGAGMPIEAR
jgi:hypothetical protein